MNAYNHTKPAKLDDRGDQYISSATLATATALTIPDGAKYALIQAEGQAVRWRGFGLIPTATQGTKLAADADIFYTGDLAKIRFIRVADGASLNIQYYA